MSPRTKESSMKKKKWRGANFKASREKIAFRKGKGIYEVRLNQVQIAEIIGVNRTTILRDIKYLKEKEQIL